jgi:hypothetical protein
MKASPRMPGEPGTHLGMPADSVVVEDRVNELASWHRGLDPVQKSDEFLVAMARHALADHRALEDVERREQRGRAMPDIIEILPVARSSAGSTNRVRTATTEE